MNKSCLLLFAVIIVMMFTVNNKALAACLDIGENGGWTGWVNSCSEIIYVIWNDQGSCQPQTYRRYPCGGYVPAYGKQSENFYGSVVWIECKASEGLPQERSDGVYCVSQ